MAITVTCLRCRRDLDEPGGLMFSPPHARLAPHGDDLDWTVSKDHLCATCYPIVRAALEAAMDCAQTLPEGNPDSLSYRIERALLARHPVTLHPQRARNYAELAAFVANGNAEVAEADRLRRALKKLADEADLLFVTDALMQEVSYLTGIAWVR